MSETTKPIAVFISQLRTLDDMTGLFPPDWHEKVRLARESGSGFIASPPFDIMGRATGYLVLLLRSGAEVMADVAGSRQKVMEMTDHAANELGADVIGLGSLTTSITRSGLAVAEYIDSRGYKLRATHGDTGSVMAITECIGAAAVRLEDTVAVVGAYGVIGTALSRYLARKGHRLIIHGRKPDELFRLLAKIKADGSDQPMMTGDIRHLSTADCIVTVTSSTDALLTPGMLKKGAVAIDPSVPANVADDPAWRAPEHDNIVISNASQVRLPGVNVQSAMFGTHDDPDGCATSYACFAETLLQAAVIGREHHVGDIDLCYVEKVRSLYEMAGFNHAILRMFGQDARQLLMDRRMAKP